MRAGKAIRNTSRHKHTLILALKCMQLLINHLAETGSINLGPTSVLPAVHVGKVVIGGANAFLLVANGVLTESLSALEGLFTW